MTRTVPTPGEPRQIFGRVPARDLRRIAEIVRDETVGGLVLLIAAAAGLILANSGLGPAYSELRGTVIGPESLHLHLTLGQWASDGLLAIFFFVAGLELKQEFVVGDLRDPRRAIVPVLAACGGVLTPALIFLAITAGMGSDVTRGWAIPSATDIAFALAVLAVVGNHLPARLRTFLLTLAVVDDLLAICIIAIFYTDSLHPGPLLLALAAITVFGVLVRQASKLWWLLIPLGVVAWAAMHASGIHATIAGVLLAFTVPTSPRGANLNSLAEHYERRWRPVSSGFAVPIFAFFAAGVWVGGVAGLGEALSGRVAIAIMLALVAGKTIGVLGTTFIVARFQHATPGSGLSWLDGLGVSMLAGIGFTVSLLIADLSFAGTALDAEAKIAVLTGSVIASLLGSGVLRARDRAYRKLDEAEDPEQAE